MSFNDNSREREENATKVMEHLRCITADEAEEFFFDDISMDETSSSNCESDLTDPFSDMGDTTKTKKTFDIKKKRLSRIETDKILMSSFSSDFLKTQEEMSESMMQDPDNKFCTEDLSVPIERCGELHDECNINNDNDNELKQTVKTILETCCLPERPKNDSPKPQKELPSDIRDHKHFMRKSPVLSEIIEMNSLSGIWRMLEAESVQNGFPLTPIGYNVFEDKRLEGWLTRRKEYSWDENEIARKKCEDWLKQIK